MACSGEEGRDQEDHACGWDYQVQEDVEVPGAG